MGDASAVTFGLGPPAGPAEWGVADGWLVEGREPIVALDELPVAGLHNAANALAAHALCRSAGLGGEPLARAIREFRGLPHRVERVAAARGVVFYDDSKGTNVGATVAALAGMRETVVLIAGGEGKGQDFAPLAPAVKRKARAVVLIGRDAPAAGSGAGRHGRARAFAQPRWTRRWRRPSGSRPRATRCSSRPPARASTCSPTTSSAAQAFAAAARALAKRMEG